MKRTGSILALFLCLFTFHGGHADAQFFKKLFGRKEPVRKPVQSPKGAGKPAPVAKKPKPARKTKAEQLDYPVSKVKSRYRVDVLVPLYLDELVKNGKAVGRERIPDKAAPGISFYEGIRLAADTLDKYGYHIDVFVHDVTDPAETAETLIVTHRLDSSDLIIGAVGGHQVSVVAGFAKKNRINFISALSPLDASVKDNPYFTLLQPTLQTHCEWLRKTVASRHGNGRILVYHRASGSTDELAYTSLVRDGGFDITEVNASVLPKIPQLKAQLDSTGLNVIVMPIVDVAYAEQLLTQLHTSFPDYQFEVYGMPSWKGMASLRKVNALSNIAVYITAPFYFDPSTASGQHLSAQYGRMFGGRPGELVFRGYETLYWYGYLLNRYGSIFNENMSDNGAATFTRFDIRPRWDKEENLLYNENGHLYLYRFQAGSYSVEQ